MYDGLKNEKLFILNHSLVKNCKKTNLYCIDLAAKLEGQIDFWFDRNHTTALGSKIIAETIIDDLVKIIKQKKLF